MSWPNRRFLTALALAVLLALPAISRTEPAAATPAPPGDGLSGTWQVSRICLSICLSPPGVLKLVHPLHAATGVFVTSDPTSQVLYRIGTQVLVHGPKDSSVLTIRTLGRLMSGVGVGADGSTFTTTWRCIAPAAPVPTVPGVTSMHLTITKPAEAPMAITLC
jgi:hypothetical protein